MPGAPTTHPAPMPSRAISIVGLSGEAVRADVAELGQGSPIVFLHGLVGLNDHWEEVVRRVQSRCRCVMLQLPLLRLKGEDCSIDGATAITVRFLESFVESGKARPVLVGNSFGGHVALKIALDRPELLRGLVLAGASGLIEKSMVADIQIRPSREWMERKIGELFFDQSKMNQADVDRAFQELSHRPHARAMVKLSRSARRNHLGEEIERISTPTLVLWGRQDIVTPPEAAEQFAGSIRGSRVVWFDRCGHAPMIECAESFAEALADFSEEVDRGARSA